MKQRSPLTVTLLSVFVPFYILYWFYVTAEELTKRGGKKPNFALLYGPFLGLAAIIPFAILGSAADMSALNVLTALVAVVAIGSMLVCPVIYYYKFSEAAEQVTNAALNKGLLFVLFWFVAPAGVFLTQDKLNTLDGSTGPSQNPQSMASPPGLV